MAGKPLPAGLVVAPQAEAAHEGAAVLRSGGNAADALVTAALVQGVTDPHRSGIGGFGCATIFWTEPREVTAVSFHGRAGRNCRPDQWARLLEQPAPDGFGFVIRGKVNDVGYQSITTPGMLAGLGTIHRRHGRLPWKVLVERAARLADSGFLVGPGLAEFWIRPGLHGRVSTRDRLALTEYGRQMWLDPAGETFRSGHHVRLPDLGATYRQIAAEGPETFYRGSLSRTIVEDFEKNGASVTESDLAGYRAAEEKPLEGSFRGHRVLTSPLPGGGVALLQALSLIERHFPTAVPRPCAESIDTLAGIFSAVWRDRLEYHGDPAFQEPGADELLSPDYLRRLTATAATGGTPAPRAPESPDTTQLSIVDRHHNCISFSHSLGYGSGVFTPDLGFMYNNCMSGFDPRPGKTASIATGKSRSTAIAETIVLRDDRPFLVLGSPGAARITAALAQVITHVIDHGMPLAEAVLQPRFDAHGDRTLLVESRFPLDLVERLGELGWDVTQSPKPFGVVGRVYGVEITPAGQLIGGVDPGDPGAAVAG